MATSGEYLQQKFRDCYLAILKDRSIQDATMVKQRILSRAVQKYVIKHDGIKALAYDSETEKLLAFYDHLIFERQKEIMKRYNLTIEQFNNYQYQHEKGNV